MSLPQHRLFGLWFLIAATLLSLLPATIAQAQPTAAQIEQFRQLPRAQQEALAAQYGVDLDALTQGAGAAQPAPQPTTVIAPRPQKREPAPQKTVAPQDDSQPLEPYGYDLFAGAPTTFEPLTDIPVPADYILGPGDTLNVQLFGKESATYTLPVNRDGSLQLPDLGPISVVGLSFEAAREAIARKIENEKIGITANITLGELRSIRVFVLGEAYQSGSYSVSSLSTITNALFLAGGIRESGSLRNIQLKRQGKLIATLDLYDLLMRGDTRNDLRLQPGDAIFIPQAGSRVGIRGEVQRPALYEVTAGEAVRDVIAMAGGIKPAAYPRASVIERIDAQHLRTAINLDLTTDRDRAQPVRNGDLIQVRSTADHFDNTIALVGAANRPGIYQWRADMRVTDILRSRLHDVHANTDLDYALVIREIDHRGNIQVLQFNLANAFGNPTSPDNLALHSRDRILLFQRFEFDTSRDAFLDELMQQSAQEAAQRTAASQTSEGAQPTSDDTVTQGQADTLAAQTIAQIREQQLTIQRSAYRLAEKGLSAYNDPAFLPQTRLFSRKQLLSPVIAQLREQGKAGAPITTTEIAGAVKYPGEYPISEGGSVKDLIIAAGGLVDSAYTESIELTRFNPGSADNEVTHLQLALSEALGSSGDQLKLQSRDRLNVLTEPNWQQRMTVTLKGEVQFPGEYAIRRGETLGDLLQRAGGLTRFAFARGSVFTRERLKEEERRHFETLAQDLRKEIAARAVSIRNVTPTNYTEESKMLADLARFQPVGRMVVDIPGILAGDTRMDVKLEHNDVIIVPAARQVVSVIGEVQHPTSHLFDPALNVTEYLERSGGPKARGDTKRIYVIKADGSVAMAGKRSWFARNNTVEPGDTIVVPLNTSYGDSLTVWAQITQIMYQTGVAIAAIATL